MNNSRTWSKTETKRRLTVGAKLARKACGQRHNNTRVEVGTRLIPTTSTTPPHTRTEADALCYPDGDDLDTMWYREDLLDGLVAPGDVLHFYVSESCAPGDWPELFDIVVVWLGYGEMEPRVIDPRFVSYDGQPIPR